MVQLGRIKGIKGRLVIRIFRFPTSSISYIRGNGRDEGGRKKKDVEKFAPFPAARSRFSHAASSLPRLSRYFGSPLQGANVCINRP